jgi:hypothetical protein
MVSSGALLVHSRTLPPVYARPEGNHARSAQAASRRWVSRFRRVARISPAQSAPPPDSPLTQNGRFVASSSCARGTSTRRRDRGPSHHRAYTLLRTRLCTAPEVTLTLRHDGETFTRVVRIDGAPVTPP